MIALRILAHSLLVCSVVVGQAEFQVLPRTVPPSVWGPTADFDGDGHLEMISVWGDRRFASYMGSNRFAPSFAVVSPCGILTYTLGIGDVNGDGHTDILICRMTCLPILLLGDGALGFADVSATHLPTMPPNTYYSTAVFVDVDGDGDLDALMGPTAPRAIEVLINDGAGRFVRDPIRAIDASVFGGGGAIQYLTPVDIDNDGDQDLVIGISGYYDGITVHYASRVYRNNGAGQFTFVQEFINFPGHNWIEVGDVNGDGFVDLMMFNPRQPGTVTLSGSPPHLMLNDGTGRFVRDNSGLPALNQEYRGMLADFDGDGDIDIIAPHFTPIGLPNGEYAMWAQWINDGSGGFTEADPELMPRSDHFNYRASLPVAADIDGDGDLDIVTSGLGRPYSPGSPQVLWNMKRHLYPPAEPRLGHIYDVEVYADAGHRVGLLLSFGATLFEVGDLGMLRVDPTIAFALPTEVVPAWRKVTYQIPISTDPALLGLELHLQGLDIEPVTPAKSRLTGVYRDVVQP